MRPIIPEIIKRASTSTFRLKARKRQRIGQPSWQVTGTLLLLLLMVIGAACSPTASPAPTATPEPEQGLIGTWTTTVGKEDILRIVPDFNVRYLCENSGTFVWKFKEDGTFTVDQTGLPDCPAPENPHMEDAWVAEGNLVTFAKGTPDAEVYLWAVQGDVLTFKHESGECVPCKAVNTANPWKLVRTSAAP